MQINEQLQAEIAHEINTPSQYVGGNMRFLRDGFQDIDMVLGKFNKLLEAAKDHNVTDALIAQVEAALRDADITQTPFRRDAVAAGPCTERGTVRCRRP